MTGFGIYMVIYIVCNMLSGVWFAGRGGVQMTPGALVAGAIWSAANLAGILLIGTGSL